MIDTSTDTDVKQAAAQEFQRRNEASAELAKSAEHWTQEAVVRAKSEHLPPPSKEMKVSLQVPAYKEISSQDVLEHFDHLPAFLERTLEEVLALDNPEQVELLVNVNNPAGMDDESKVGNTRSVQLLRLIANPNIDVDQAMQQLYEAGWIINPSQPQSFISSAEQYRKLFSERGMFDEDEREQLEQLVQSRVEEDKERLERALENEKRYRKMVTLGKIALARGMRLCIVDCTDGVYISKLNDADEVHENSQGARRRLLSEISKNRAEAVGTNPWVIPIDADCQLAKGALKNLVEDKITSQVFFSLPEFKSDSHIPGFYEEEVEEVTKYLQDFANLRMIRSLMISMANRLYGWQSGDQNYAKHSLSVTPFAGSYGFRLDAYQEIGGWSIEKDSGEDADMMSRLARNIGNLQQLDTMVEISGRVRGESFLGNEASIVSIAGSKLSIEARVASALTAQPYEQVVLDHFIDLIRQHLILACQEITRRPDVKPGPLGFFSELQNELSSNTHDSRAMIDVLYRIHAHPVLCLWLMQSSQTLQELAQRFTEQKTSSQ